MSQNNIIPSPLTSSDALDNSNDDDWKSVDEIQDDLKVINNDGWANFDNTNQNSKTIPVIATDDNWADFASNTEPSTEHSIHDKQSEKINKDDDVFGDYGEVQISPKSQISSLPINFLNSEHIESLISTCFPLEPSTLSTDIDNFIPFELPTLTTFKDQTKQLPCFKYSLSLWNKLSNIPNDPIGIKYQWRKSNIEHLFHHALGVQERFRTKTIPLIPDIPITSSNVNTENNSLSSIVDPHFDWKQSGLENPLTDINTSSPLTDSSKPEDNIFDINKTLDLDYYVPPLQTSTSIKEEQTTSSPKIYRNDSPIVQQQSTPIKTMDLYPGSTTVLNDDVKPVVNSIPNFSFMNPKALMFPTQITHESTI